jgi:hypothetical protein
MKIFLRHILVIGLILSLYGCLYGQCLDGPCALELEKMIRSIKPYIERWIKEGMSRESRIQDSISCGGNGDRGPGFSTQQLNAARQLEDKNDFAPEARLSMAWVECMKSKGYEYRYTGTY